MNGLSLIKNKSLFFYYIGTLFLTLILLPKFLIAGEVELIPALRLATEYDDNLDFRPSDEEDDFSASARPGFTLNYKTELLSLNSVAEVDFQKYYNKTDYDRINQHYEIGAEYLAHQRWTLFTNGEFRRDETTDTQFEETGRVFERSRVKYYKANGGVRYNLTELTDIGTNLIYQKTDFSGGDDIDYDRYTIEFPYRKKFKNQLDTIYLVPAYSYFDSDTEEADDYRFTVTWRHLLSETLSSDISLGARYTDIEEKATNQQDSNWGGTGEIALRKQGETFSGDIGYIRDLRADTEGNIIQVNRGFIRGDKRITERFGFKFDGNYYYTTREQQDAQSEKVQSFNLAPACYYMLTENHSLELSYRYRREVELDEPGNPTTQQNRATLRLILLFPKKWD